jgi:hypothetical protein
MIIEGDEVFYLGDNPMVLQRTDNPNNGSGLGLDVKGVEAFTPFTKMRPIHALQGDRR